MVFAFRPLAPFGRVVSVNIDLVLAALALIALIVAGVVVIVWVDRWRKRSAQQAPGDELQTFRALFEQGMLSVEEFERIRGRMDRKDPEQKPPSSTAVKASDPQPAGKENIAPGPPPSSMPNGPASPG